MDRSICGIRQNDRISKIMKRFTESAKWSDPWFRNLTMENKCLWLWLLDNCDCAGIIEVDSGLAEFQIGATKPLLSPYQALGERVQKHGEKLFIPKFIAYQYGTELNTANSAHRGVIKRLELAKIACPVSIVTKSSVGATKPLNSPYQGAKDKDKDKDKDLVKEKKSKTTFVKPSESEMREYAKSIGLPESDGLFMLDHWDGNGWKNGQNKVVCWKAGIRKWKSKNWLPSQDPVKGIKLQSRDDRHPNELKETIDISTLPVWDAMKQ